NVAVHGEAGFGIEGGRPNEHDFFFLDKRSDFLIRPGDECAGHSEDLLSIDESFGIRSGLFGVSRRFDDAELDLASINPALSIDLLEIGSQSRFYRLAHFNHRPLPGYDRADGDALLSQSGILVLAQSLKIGDQVGQILARHPVTRHRVWQLVTGRVHALGDRAFERVSRVRWMLSPAGMSDAVGFCEHVGSDVRRHDAAFRIAAAIEAMTVC